MGHVLGNVADVLILVLFFSFTIFVHELGHFLVARKLGFVVRVFSIGFGPAIWQKRINGILYKISWVPFGGYVSLPQLDPTGMELVQGKDDGGEKDEKKKDDIEDQIRTLPNLPAWKKILVAVWGAGGNIVLACVIAWCIYLHPDAVTGDSGPVKIMVREGSEAHDKGLRTGDSIVGVNGKSIDSLYEFRVESLLGTGQTNVLQLSVISKEGSREISLDSREGGLGLVDIEGVGYLSSCVIGGFTTNSPSRDAGFKLGDIVRKIDGEDVLYWQHLLDLSDDKAGKTVSMVVERNGEAIEKTVELGQAREDLPLCEVAEVTTKSSAEKAGVAAGDQVLMFDGIAIMGVDHLMDLVASRGGEEVKIVLQRNGEVITKTVIPEYSEEYKRAMIGTVLIGVSAYAPRGISEVLGMQLGRVQPWMQYKTPRDQIHGDASMLFRMLKAFVTPKEAGKAAKGVGGPVAIFMALWASIQVSYLNALGFLRFLNINLAIINLLPIPILDGGHIVFALWEGITRRRIHPKVVNVLMNVCGALLLGVMLVITFKDVFITIPKIMGWSE
jgi:regulator of sigma E protease